MRFDSFAHSYDRYAAPQRAFAARVARFIQPGPQEEVLELGAGTGALTRCLLEQTSASLQATEASAAMVALGRQAVPLAHWSQLDAFASPIPRAALQVSSGLLQWAPQPAKVLEAWKEALQPGGRMVHALACEPCLKEWRQLVPQGPLQWRDAPGWCALFEQAGLRLLRQELWVEPFYFASSLELARALHRSGVTGQAHLDAGQLRRVLRDYNARHSCPQGVVSTWAWLVIEACAAS